MDLARQRGWVFEQRMLEMHARWLAWVVFWNQIKYGHRRIEVTPDTAKEK